MLRNYFKIAWRNILKNKLYSIINIGGLAVGMAVAMLIGLWIQYEFDFYGEHKNKNQIYNVVTNGKVPSSGFKYTTQATPLPLYVESKNLIPEIKHTAIVNWGGKNGLMVGDKKLTKNGTEVSEDFFKIFQFKFLAGDPNTALNDPNSIVLTESVANDLFGQKEALNQMIRWNNTDNLKVSGIVEDMKKGSVFGEREYFMAYKHLENRAAWVRESKNSWLSYSAITYAELIPDANRELVLSKIKNMIKNHDKTSQNEIGLHAMTEWRLYDAFENWEANSGRITYVKMFGIIGILVLLLACINFTNLSTAHSQKRAKEIGIRKAVGSVKRQLVIQFLTESILMVSVSMILSLILIISLLAAFNSLLGTVVVFPIQNPFFWLFTLATIITTGLLAGFYPAFYLSSFTSIKALKGKYLITKTVFSPRKILVVAQFVASISIIIGTIIIYKQIQFSKNRPLGYDAKNVVMVDIKDDLFKNYDLVKSELLAIGIVENVTKASNAISETSSNSVIESFPGSIAGETISLVNIATSSDYFKTIKIKLIEGRDFNQSNIDVDTDKVILNQAAVDLMKLTDPIGKIITERGGKRQEIIGVAENAIMENPFEPVRATRFMYDKYWASVLMFRFKENTSASTAIARVSHIFNKFNPSFPFEYRFASEEFDKKFKFEEMVGKLATFFAILAIFISCLGLFGLASFVAEQRTKEIGVRKVLGASVTSLWQMLSKDFVVLVLLSCLIAAPVAYYFMNNWLQKYTYRTEISWWIYVAAGIGALTITLLTVSFQAIKAALMNPVKSLRSE